MEIQGLNDRQRKIADMLWSMNTREQVETFIKGLPQEMQLDGRLVLDMMILAVIDEAVTDVSAAQELIERVK